MADVVLLEQMLGVGRVVLEVLRGLGRGGALLVVVAQCRDVDAVLGEHLQQLAQLRHTDHLLVLDVGEAEEPGEELLLALLVTEDLLDELARVHWRLMQHLLQRLLLAGLLFERLLRAHAAGQHGRGAVARDVQLI